MIGHVVMILYLSSLLDVSSIECANIKYVGE